MPNSTRKSYSLSFANQCLKTINQYRSLHGAKPLKTSKELMDLAQTWASYMANTNKLSFSFELNYQGKPLGQNLAVYTKPKKINFDGSMLAKGWYSEIERYDFDKNSGENTGHFTQLVWRNTREFGLGRQESKDQFFYVCGLFYPAGNDPRLMAENVFAIKQESPKESITRKSKIRQRFSLMPKHDKKKSWIGKRLSRVSDVDRQRTNMEQECLDVINKQRKLHRAPILKLDKDLSIVAQEWADTLIETGQFDHNPNRKFKNGSKGENLALNFNSGGTKYTTGKAAQQWYDEIKDFNWETRTGKGTGHFTQNIWKDCELLGVGRAVSKDGKTCVVVANFYPAGNYVGEYFENVLQARASIFKRTSKAL